MKSKDFMDECLSSHNHEDNTAIQAEHEQRAVRKKLKKKLKKCIKLYKSARFAKKSLRKKHKKKIRKLERQLMETENQLNLLRIKMECEERMFQWCLRFLSVRQLPDSQTQLDLPNFAARREK